MTVQFSRHRFTVSDYYRMAEVGILHQGQRVELIHGEIFEMPPIGSNHAGIVNRLMELLRMKIPLDDAMVSVQNPVRLSDMSEPVPDIALLRRRDDFYQSGHPSPGDVLCLVEVADSTLQFDRDTKVPLYAKAGIPEYWIVDVNASSVEILRDPGAAGYQSRLTARRGDTIAPQRLPQASIAVSEILG